MDPCVLRLIVGGEVITVMVIHVDDIQIASSQEVVEVVISVLSDEFPATCENVIVFVVPWYMGSDFRRDERKIMLEISQTQLIHHSLDRCNATKTSSFPASSSWDIVCVSDGKGRGG